MTNHQKLSKYNGEIYGEPRYQGIEYDWEVPDNIVVASPGGVSSVHHHWTKGFDGRGNTSSDVYAGQGERYNSGVYGNLYQTGHESGQSLGLYPKAPDYQYWKNEEPGQYADTHSNSDLWAPAMNLYNSDGYQSPPSVVEGFSDNINSMSDYDLLQPSDGEDISAADGGLSTLDSDVYENYEQGDSLTFVEIPKFRPWLILLLFLFGFVVYDAWASAGHSYITQVLNKGKSLTWKQYLTYAIVMTVILVITSSLAGIPLRAFEGKNV